MSTPDAADAPLRRTRRGEFGDSAVASDASMHGESVDGESAVGGAAEPEAGESPERTRRRDWRLGGRTVARWRERVLALALIALGVGVLGGTALVTFVSASWAPLVATVLLWVAMLIAIVYAFVRSRPAGLLGFRAQDLVFGLGIGLLLRLVQGWVDAATGGTGAFPSYPTIGGSLPNGWLFNDVIATVLIAPVIEEFFFRGVILVALYTLLRRPVGKIVAAAVAAVASTGIFVLVHALGGALAVDQVISLTVVGLVCASLVLLTGRIWPAVLAHVVYNGTYVVLALIGTYAG
ncbi:CPBP family intramembrane metalloprotease [Microbacterium lacus]|uniref:CPBP family intramembrane glutamic endopeptidase n=1 Tax=Microbacterium lacus TaxID=415217 RepID=UPI00384C356A